MHATTFKRRRVDVLNSDEQRFVRGALFAVCVGGLCWVSLLALL